MYFRSRLTPGGIVGNKRISQSARSQAADGDKSIRRDSVRFAEIGGQPSIQLIGDRLY